jgi:hypothetical protein
MTAQPKQSGFGKMSDIIDVLEAWEKSTDARQSN